MNRYEQIVKQLDLVHARIESTLPLDKSYSITYEKFCQNPREVVEEIIREYNLRNTKYRLFKSTSFEAIPNSFARREYDKTSDAYTRFSELVSKKNDG